MAGVCSSSSGESVTSGSGTDCSFIEEMFEEDGHCEILLVPRREVCKNNVSQDVDEDALGGVGYSEFFLACVSSLKQEELIIRSPKGGRVRVMLEAIEKIEHERIVDIATSLIASVHRCLIAGCERKLPSAAQASIWSAFHKLRCGHQIKKTWSTFVSNHIATSHQKEPQATLQLLLDRILKRLLKNKASARKRSTEMAESSSIKPLTAMESNAVRYMAGFIAVHLLRRYKKPVKDAQLKKKRSMFIRVLTGMRAVDQPGEPDSIVEYSKLWSELIDRGGLYHINDEVFHLLESIELLVRRYLNVELFTPGTDTRSHILKEVEQSEDILFYWENIASSIPAKCEPYSIELLKAITELWITIRGHSFAKEWTMKFQKSKYQKGTRKTLQPIQKV